MRTSMTLAIAAALTIPCTLADAATWESRVAASADTYVRDGSSSDTSFGSATSLVVKTTSAPGNTRVSFLRFALPGSTGNVLSARLRLYGRRPSATSTRNSVFGVADTTWSEADLTWWTQPEIGDRLGTGIVITPTARYYEWDVSDYVRARRTAGADAVSLALKLDVPVNDAPDAFNSKEADENRPELRITFTDEEAPTVAVPASSYPLETEHMAELSVLGADDGGEPNLTYTWSAVGYSPAPVEFTRNGVNSSKETWAIFRKAGAYLMRVVIRDASGLHAESTTQVIVTQRLSRIEIRPGHATIPVGGGFGWSAWGFDQFGDPIDYGVDDPTVPFPTWSVSGGGVVNTTGSFVAGHTPGQFTVSAEKEGIVGSTIFTVGAINSAVFTPLADAYVRDGSFAGTNFGGASALEIKRSETPGENRIAYFRLPLTGVSANVVSARLRLYGSRPPGPSISTIWAWGVVNNSWTESGLTWNNRPALADNQGAGPFIGTTPQYWDVEVLQWARARRAAGATSMTVAVTMDNVTDLGPDVFNSKEASANQPELHIVYMPNTAPTIARPASASPAFVTGTTTRLSVLGADDGGESQLTYTWTVLPTGWGSPVTFSTNGNNAAKNVNVQFTGAGQYAFEVTVRDASGTVAKSVVDVRVEPTLSSIRVNPRSAIAGTGEWAVFFAYGDDQFGHDMGSVDDPYLPDATWTVSGGGTMNHGAFIAGPVPGGPFTVTVSSLGVSATATVRVVPIATSRLAAAADAFVRNGSHANTNFGAAPQLEVKLSPSAGTTRIAYLRFPLTGVYDDVTQATLRLYGSRPTTSNTYYHHANAVANNSWSEGGITWNNRPSMGARQGGSAIIGPTPQYWEWDVTQFVHDQKAAGRSAVSIAIEFGVDPITDPPTIFNSKEAADNHPELIVTARQP